MSGAGAAAGSVSLRAALPAGAASGGGEAGRPSASAWGGALSTSWVGCGGAAAVAAKPSMTPAGVCGVAGAAGASKAGSAGRGNSDGGPTASSAGKRAGRFPGERQAPGVFP